MNTNSLRSVSAVLGLVFVFAQPSLGAPMAFFDRDNSTSGMSSYPNSLAMFNQFTASLSSFGVATIDTVNPGVPNPTLPFDGSTITADTSGVLAIPAATLQIGTQALVELDAVGPGQFDTTFNFSQPITGFGLYVIQGGDTAINNTTFRLTDTTTSAFVDVPIQIGPGWGGDNAFFLGVGNDFPFNQVTILESIDTSDGMLYDNIVAGTFAPAPEPSSVVLFAIGLIACIARLYLR